MLNEHEKQEIKSAIGKMILASNKTAVVLRASSSSSSNIYGVDNSEFMRISEISIELIETPPIELIDKIDALGSILPDIDIKPEDRLMIGTSTFRVQNVKHENLFGCITHISLQLVKVS